MHVKMHALDARAACTRAPGRMRAVTGALTCMSTSVSFLVAVAVASNSAASATRAACCSLRSPMTDSMVGISARAALTASNLRRSCISLVQARKPWIVMLAAGST